MYPPTSINIMISPSLYHLFLLLISATAAAATPSYNATDCILISCGTIERSNNERGVWEGDTESLYLSPFFSNLTSVATASKQNASILPIPYRTARIFRSKVTYTFQVSRGSKFIRLYFYSYAFSEFDSDENISFSVNANEYTLLSKFSYSLTPFLMKEFVINVAENRLINLTFSPDRNSLAFINGIEIVSIPEGLYLKGNGVQIKSADNEFYLSNNTALENIYRLNVGGTYVAIVNDTGPNGMFRTWSQDDKYTFGVDTFHAYTHDRSVKIQYTNETPQYSTPEMLYRTSRTTTYLDWKFPVHSGFFYLHRFHFCENQLEVTKRNRRVFTISIDNKIVEIAADIIAWTGGTQIPIFRDYLTWVPDGGKHGNEILRISLFPTNVSDLSYNNPLLNGLEIFKLSSNLSLAGDYSDAILPPESKPNTRNGSLDGASTEANFREKKKNKTSFKYAVIGSVIGVMAVVVLVCFLFLRRRRLRMKNSATKSSVDPFAKTRTTVGSHLYLSFAPWKHFLLEEIKSATDNFDETFMIGKGGFGNVYKGSINDGATSVAIKRSNPSSNQGIREFQTEIEILSKLRHRHLVSLIGYCDENEEMILVYDYMSHGTLRDHLYNTENPPLTWKQRLRICIGAAKGLQYLHTGVKQPIIHRDVKSTNILLNDKWVAKVSDFGLSKIGPIEGVHTHVSTLVKGSFGYLDPEYYKRLKLTVKSDVYSFGVVLLEVLCARPAVIPNLFVEEANLAEWVKIHYEKGTIQQIIDPNLDGKIAPNCLQNFVDCAILCLRDKGIDRPTMSDVIRTLEFSLQLQDASEAGDDEIILMLSGSSNNDLSTSGIDKSMTRDVFSEVENPLGR